MPLTFVFGLAFVTRFIFFLFHPHMTGVEVSVFWEIADNLLHAHQFALDGVKITRIEPLYPFCLALARLAGDHAGAVMLLQLAVASLGAVYLYRLSVLFTENKRVAFLAACLFLFHPYLIRQSGSWIEVSLFSSLLIAATFYHSTLYLSNSPKDSVVAGICWGLAILTRAMLWPLFLLAVLHLAVNHAKKKSLIVLGVAFLMMMPWTLRNYSVDRSLIPSRAGYDLYKGNNLYSSQLLPRFSPDLLTPWMFERLEKERPDLKGTDEKKQDQYFLSEAYKFWKEEPLQSLTLKFKNFLYFFMPRLVPFFPYSADTRVVLDGEKVVIENAALRSRFEELALMGYEGLLMSAALFGIFVRKRAPKPEGLLYLLLFGFAVIYSLFWPSTLYRAPVEFVMIFYAAVGLEKIFCRTTA